MIARVAMRILGVLASLLAAFLAIGLLLPKQVEVTRSLEIEAPADEVFSYLADLEAWTEWTPWGELESALEGPRSGPGAKRVWDDPALGSGSLTIVEAIAPNRVTYEAEVEDGAIRFFGEFLVSTTSDTHATVTWTETAQWGLNALLGWNGLTLEESQGAQLAQSLAKLEEVITAKGPR